MKFCPVVPEICRGQVHALRKERIRIIIIKIIIYIRLIASGIDKIHNCPKCRKEKHFQNLMHMSETQYG